MSLITEALQLRKANPRNRGAGGESFPPLRRPNPAGKVLLGLCFLCGVGVLIFWKGAWAVEQLENLVGIRVPQQPLAPATSAPIPEEPAKLVTPIAAEVPAKEEKPTAAVMEVNPLAAGPSVAEKATPLAAPEQKKDPAAAEIAGGKPSPVPEELQPMDVNLTLSMIEDEKARQQLDEENQRKIESFLRRMDVQGVCHQGEDSTALLDTTLVRPGDQVGTMGLTLKTIEARRLVFADRNGREYTKSY